MPRKNAGNTKRINLALNPKLFDAVQKLADRRSTSFSELTREALTAYVRTAVRAQLESEQAITAAMKSPVTDDAA